MVICDIDGCIFGNEQRAHLIPKDRGYTPNWTQFNEACVDDEPIWPVINLVKHLAGKGKNKIIFVTSRGENVRQQTQTQLISCFADHFDVFGFPGLVMRAMDDHRNTVDYKRDVLKGIDAKFNEWSIIIDDHPGIVEMVQKDFPALNRLLVPSYDCTVINDCQI
jgi:hypothetical protein